MNNKYKLSLAFGVLFSLPSFAQVASQKIGTNPTIIQPNAVLEIESSNKGVLFPRIALTGNNDITTIPSPITSMLIYNTATAGTAPNDVTPGYYYWTGAVWTRFSSGTELDGVIGNEVLNATTNGGLIRSGAGTSVSPYTLGITPGSTNGQVLKWDGTQWSAGAETEPWYNVATGTYASANTQNIYQMGNVGIGTSTPANRLEVTGGNIQISDHGGALLFNNSGIAGYNSGDMFFLTSGTEKMRLLNNGNLGIGTNSPSQKLEVSGNVNNGDVRSLVYNTSNSNGASASTQLSTGIANSYYVSALQNGGGSPYLINAVGPGVTGGVYHDAPFHIFRDASATERMRIVGSSGNVAIGTSNPAADAILDITSNSKALLLTRVPNTASIANPVNGMIIYDISSQCIKSYENNVWSVCLSNSAAPPSLPVVTANCDQNGFTGNYLNGIALSGASFTVTITNNSFNAATISFQNSDLVLSGASGVSVSSTSPASVTLNAGQSQTITYNLTGTPLGSSLTGTWTKLSLNCTKTQAVCEDITPAQNGLSAATAGRSCNTIKTAFPASADGVYWIDPDGTCGTTYSPMQAQCDMTTDGGGWTLVFNYVHKLNTNPTMYARNYLPLIGSNVIGTDESSSTVYWGHAEGGLMSVIPFSTVRVYGLDGSNSAVVNVKSSDATLVNVWKNTGSTYFYNKPWTTLTGHTSPGPANSNDGWLVSWAGLTNGNILWYVNPQNDAYAWKYTTGITSWGANGTVWGGIPDNRSTIFRWWVK